MDPDPAGAVGPISRLVGSDKLPGSTQRASEITQDQIAEESVAALNQKAPTRAIQVRREKIRQDRERRQKALERHQSKDKNREGDDPNTESGIDLLA